MTRRILAVAGAIGLAGTAALAQTGTYESTGDGRMRTGFRDADIQRVRLTLEGDRDFILTINGERSGTIRGRWESRPGSVVTLRVESAFDRNDATGNGTVVLIGREVSRLDMGGRYGGQNFQIQFSRDAGLNRGNGRWNVPQQNNDWRNRDLNTRATGQGQLRIDGRGTDRLRDARVILERDGDFRIELRGDRTTNFSGRWSGGRSNVIDLDVRNMGTTQVRGSGKLTMSGNSGFRQLQLRGDTRRGNDRFDVNFTANANNGGRWGDRDNWDDWDDRNLREASGSYRFEHRFREDGENYWVRYRLNLRNDGEAIMEVEADRDILNDRDAMRAAGDVVRYVDRNGRLTQRGNWRMDGRDVVVRFDGLTSGVISPRMTLTLRGGYRNGVIDFSDFDKGFYGQDNDLEFRR